MPYTLLRSRQWGQGLRRRSIYTVSPLVYMARVDESTHPMNLSPHDFQGVEYICLRCLRTTGQAFMKWFLFPYFVIIILHLP